MLTFCGLRLKNQLIVSASPATESYINVKNCAIAGAGAVILKSMGPEHIIKNGGSSPRRMLFKDGTLYMLSSSRREILNIEDGLKLISLCRKNLKIPIIASVCGLYKEPEEWQEICKLAIGAGANTVQLDTIYSIGLSKDINKSVFNGIVNISEDIQQFLKKPILLKINPNDSVQMIMNCLKNKKIALSLLDSIPVGIPLDINSKNYIQFRGIKQAGDCLAAGKILFPLSLHYTQKLYRAGIGPICAGGGIFNANDAMALLISGAQTFQIATVICVYGFGVIQKILNDLDKITYKNKKYTLIKKRQEFHKHIGEYTIAIPGQVIRGKNNCGKCKQSPCERTIMCGNRQKDCEGCGICIDVCQQKKAKFKEALSNGKKGSAM